MSLLVLDPNGRLPEQFFEQADAAGFSTTIVTESNQLTTLCAAGTYQVLLRAPDVEASTFNCPSNIPWVALEDELSVSQYDQALSCGATDVLWLPPAVAACSSGYAVAVPPP